MKAASNNSGFPDGFTPVSLIQTESLSDRLDVVMSFMLDQEDDLCNNISRTIKQGLRPLNKPGGDDEFIRAYETTLKQVTDILAEKATELEIISEEKIAEAKKTPAPEKVLIEILDSSS